MSRRSGSNEPPKSAGELMAELKNDPGQLKRMREQEQQQRDNLENYRKAAEPILKDLAAIGFCLNSVGELRRSGKKYKTAIPVLLKWLPQVSNLMVKEDIVRTLAVSWAKPAAAHALIEEFKKVHDPTGTGIRWAIANSLEVVGNDAVFDEIVHLIQDKKYGKAREMLVVSLGNMKNSGAPVVLVNLLRDEDLAGYAVMALGKLKVVEARQEIEGLLNHSKPWIRKEVTKALAIIDRVLARQGDSQVTKNERRWRQMSV